MISQSLVKEFQRLLGAEQVFLEETDRATYSYDAAVLEPVMPAIVQTRLPGRVGSGGASVP
jgi:glycolate oxidase